MVELWKLEYHARMEVLRRVVVVLVCRYEELIPTAEVGTEERGVYIVGREGGRRSDKRTSTE